MEHSINPESAAGVYVATRVRSGATKAQVTEELAAVGWSEEEVEAAYRDGVVALGAPLPKEADRPKLASKSSTVDVVINLFSFVLLGIVASALGTLYFGIIEEMWPDTLLALGAQNTTSSIHYAIAALLISFPLYVAVMRVWFRHFREDEGRRESRLSQWLTYVVLLIAAVTLVGDLIVTVFTFLQGEVTMRFFLKALTLFGIAGGVFGFYVLERKYIQYRQAIKRTAFQYFGAVVAGIILIGIGIGFVVGGSPETARQRSFDAERVQNLASLSTCIEDFSRNLGALPLSLDQLVTSNATAYCSNFVNDPETGQAYAYRVVTPERAQGPSRVGDFELCAYFSLDSSGSEVDPFSSSAASRQIWMQHAAGRQCHTVSAQLGSLAPRAPLTPLTPLSPESPR